MKALYLSIFLLTVSSNVALSEKCSCSASEYINLKLVNAIGLGATDNMLGFSSKKVCVNYSMIMLFGIIPWPNVNIGSTVSTESCNPKNNDGSIECIIQDPLFTIAKQCYPPKLFCVHQVVCPSDHIATIQCSSLDLPSSNEKCLDSLYVSSGRLRNKEVCKGNCFPAINEAGGSRIRVSFVSGQCCQKCGYRIVVRCIPQLSISGPRGIKGSKGSQGSVKRDIEEHNIEERGARGPVGPVGPPGRPPAPSEVVVPLGAVVTYNNKTLTVKLGKLKLQERKTPKLQVRDDLAFGVGNLFEAKTSANRSFVGYGIMKIYSNRIYFHQQGIPTEEIPNAEEEKFIQEAILHIKISSQGTGQPGPKGSPGTSGPIGSPSPSCDCNRGPPPGPPGPPSRNFFATARRYAKDSKKRIVKFFAILFLKLNKEPPTPTTPPGKVGPPGLPGPAGPPGPSNKGPSGPPGSQ